MKNKINKFSCIYLTITSAEYMYALKKNTSLINAFTTLINELHA